MSDAYAAAGAIASEALSSIRTVAAFGLERVAAERYERKLKKAEKIGIALVWQAGFAMSWMIAAICIMMVSGLLYGGLDVSSEQQAVAHPAAGGRHWAPRHAGAGGGVHAPARELRDLQGGGREQPRVETGRGHRRRRRRRRRAARRLLSEARVLGEHLE